MTQTNEAAGFPAAQHTRGRDRVPSLVKRGRGVRCVPGGFAGGHFSFRDLNGCVNHGRSHEELSAFGLTVPTFVLLERRGLLGKEGQE